ncbi:MAG: macro domain-containing protein [Candidatus Dependentiae bacterium]|nr:macro domain-containing protein [Candidatus Dependentiae bacterium]
MTSSSINQKGLAIILSCVALQASALRTEYVFKGAGIDKSDVALTLVRGDITKQNDVQIIVNAANKTLLGGAGVDGAIHAAAGYDLADWIENNVKEITPGIRCKTGDAVSTEAFNLKNLGVRYIIHTVGPDCRIRTQSAAKETLLAASYSNSLDEAMRLAAGNSTTIRTVAFPSISTAIYAYPVAQAAQLVISTIAKKITMNNFPLREVRMVLFSAADLNVYAAALERYAVAL